MGDVLVTRRPQTFSARQTDVVVEPLGGDLLVLDRRADAAHCLGEAAALVWRSCASGATVGDLAEILIASGLAGSLGDATTLAEAALSELDEKGLLESAQAEGMPRRQALRRITGVGAAAVGAPLIVSAALPTSAFANLSTPCVSGGNECTTAGGPSNCCSQLYCDTQPGNPSPTCHDCYTTGNKPQGADCTTANQYKCCTGTCGTGMNANFCG
jgi:hypothetical protein